MNDKRKSITITSSGSISIDAPTSIDISTRGIVNISGTTINLDARTAINTRAPTINFTAATAINLTAPATNVNGNTTFKPAVQIAGTLNAGTIQSGMLTTTKLNSAVPPLA